MEASGWSYSVGLMALLISVELRIELGNGTVPSIVWTYQLFKLGGADTNYRLTIGQGTGVGGTRDAMAISNGASFTTRDRDHDTFNTANCAKVFGGAWWSRNCLWYAVPIGIAT